MPSNTLVSKARRFACTGVAATAIHIMVAFACIRFGELAPSLSNALASIVATGFSYLAHTLWSFSETVRVGNFRRFIVVSLGACVLAATLAALAEQWGFPYWVGIAWVVCIVPAATFSAHYLWTYRR